MLALVLVVVLFIAQDYFLAQVLDAAIRLEQPMGTLGGAIGGVAALIVIRALLSWSGQRSASRAVEQIKEQLAAQIFAQMLRRGAGWARRHTPGWWRGHARVSVRL